MTKNAPTNIGFRPDRWFCTPIWARKVKDHERINASILSALEEIEADSNVIVRSNIGGWHSHDKLHKREDFGGICQIISSTLIGCATHMDFDFENYRLAIKEMWLNKNFRGCYNRGHVHPNAFLSGVYYVRTPESCGDIEFHHPSPARLMTNYPKSRQRHENAEIATYKAEEGLLLIFPAWIQHSVQPNQNDEPRVSLSFNACYGAAHLPRDSVM